MKLPERPRTNNAAPSVDKRVTEGLRAIGYLDGQPYLRLIWGQTMDTTYTYRSEEHLRYRDHVDHEFGMGEYGLDGQIKRYYKRGDIYPMGVILKPIRLDTDIGIDRFFVEYAQPYDPDVWRSESFTNERGEVELDQDGNPLMFLGECPPSGIDYDMLWCVADHRKCCIEGSHILTGVGVRDDNQKCYGYYRAPSMRDVEEAQRRWWLIVKTRPNTYGLRDRVPEELLRRDRQQSFEDAEREFEDGIRKLAEECYQFMLPHTKRLYGEGSGLDLEKYHILDSSKIKSESKFSKENV